MILSRHDSVFFLMVAALPRCVFCAFSRQIPLLQLAKINRNFEVFTATDFLAAITQHFPDPARRGSATMAGTVTRCAVSAIGACRRS